MKKGITKFIIIIVITIVFIITPVSFVMPQNKVVITVKAATVKISAKKLSLTVGQSKTLKIKGTKTKVKWSTSNREVAVVNKKGKVTAKKAGKAKITARVAKKKYTCTVVVKKKKVTPKPQETTTKAPTPQEQKPEAQKAEQAGNNLSILKEYILTYGEEDENGDKYIVSDGASQGFTAGILYKSSSNLFQFVFGSSTDTGAAANSALLLEISETDIKNGNFRYIIVEYSSGIYGACNACETLSTLHEDSTLNWIVEDSNIPVEGLLDIANLSYKVAFSYWDLLMYSKVNLTMSDIGFME